MEDFVELALHRDHLFAHVEGDFGAFEIDAHFFDEQPGDAHSIDLIDGINFFAPPENRRK